MNSIQRKTRAFGAIILICIVISCQNKTVHDVTQITSSTQIKWDSKQKYKEAYRPQFHFSPEKNWMNDPNGMVFYKGVYHLFYQYYPEDIVWGPMHWGHAVSTDLVHWEPKKIALFPDDLGMIFSGSAVIDGNNSSGLGTKSNPPMIAIFTYHDMTAEKAGAKNYQTQGLAYSLDNGETWTKYKQNPIIANPNLKDFRDPKVFWNATSKSWTMVLVAGDRAQFYTSKNLIKWELKSEFGSTNGAHGGVWECPDLFKLKVNGSTEEKWVLLISINPGAPQGGSGTQYFVGDFDGKTFTTDQKDIKWVDYGTDNYAGVTYSSTPHNKRIFIGWMSNWSYARNTPTKKWRSAMTIPRELTLAKNKNTYVLKNTPINQLKKQITTVYARDKITLKKDQKKNYEYPNLNQSEIEFRAKNENLKLVFSNSKEDSLVLNYDAKQKIFTVDRRNSGQVNFEKSFGEKKHQTMVEQLNTEYITYQILLDWSSIELFLNNGTYSFTEQLFPNEPYTKLTISSPNNQEIKSFTVNKVKSIW